MQGIVFNVVGTGNLRKNMSEAIRTANLMNINMIGDVGSKVADYYRNANILIIPGRGGMIISEAMAMQLPVICDRFHIIILLWRTYF